MPFYKTYREGDRIYSVDMLIAYVNLAKVHESNVFLSTLMKQLDKRVWGKWSPNEVLAKRTGEDWKRIVNADLAFPVILSPDGTVLDGYHRVAKAIYEGMSSIKAIFVDDETMEKCLLTSDGDVGKVQDWPVHAMITTFVKGFFERDIYNESLHGRSRKMEAPTNDIGLWTE